MLSGGTCKSLRLLSGRACSKYVFAAKYYLSYLKVEYANDCGPARYLKNSSVNRSSPLCPLKVKGDSLY